MKKNYFLLLCSLLLGVAIQAQTYQTWRSDSGTGDNSWQNSVNWWNFPDPSPIVFGQQEWDNNHLPAQVNSADISTWRFLFKSGASDAHTFTGNQISFFDFGGSDPQIINQSTATHIINNNINGDPDAADPLTFVIDNTGGLTFGGAINNQGWIDINGSTASATTITINGIISGTGGVTKENTNITLNYKSSNTYSGATNINNGTLILEGSLASSAVTVGANGTLQISENTTLSSLTVDAGGIVIIDAGKSLTITNNLVNNGTSFTVNSGSSLIVNGTSSGNITYTRNLATANWYLISSPVVGEDATDFLTNSSGISNNGSANAIGTYSDGWTYNYSSTLESGAGYAVKKDAPGNLVFTGTFQSSSVAKLILDTTSDFNLFGNPYTSYIAANSNADGTNNLLTVNTASGQDELAEATIWLWNQGTDSYDQVNQVSGAFHIAPGQGFFIKGKSGSGDTFFDFTEAMQSHQSSDSFQKSASTRPEVKLMLTDGTMNRDADIYYIDGKTKGFDNGYDSSIFGGVNHVFTIYTEAVANSDGKRLGIQSLPNQDFESMVIPVGVIAASGKEITFTAEALNLPSGIKVYLEDREANNVTRLDEANSNYKVTLNTALNGTGRFFLHTRSSALSTEEVALTGVGMYTINNNTLRVNGINSDKASIKIYNILGKKVLDSSFTSKGVSDVSLPNLNTGVYIVQLVTEKGKISKKIILE
ncbi:T9SS type A sorting domain-containing protein [Polaribacter marinivivus]|uniref:T9SS type A sorting domain-containing protein n=1 Tax=Polaribacter marinivivus TaxID=1524260 RepID=A0ABV8RBJ8_9FLAO